MSGSVCTVVWRSYVTHVVLFFKFGWVKEEYCIAPKRTSKLKKKYTKANTEIIEFKFLDILAIVCERFFNKEYIKMVNFSFLMYDTCAKFLTTSADLTHHSYCWILQYICNINYVYIFYLFCTEKEIKEIKNINHLVHYI